MKIAVEPPRKKNHIVQCTRCQSYGHTKTYCSRPFACVKCGGEHKTTLCTKDPAAPATCALCGGDHPASYKGCTIYKNIQQARGKILRPPHPTANPTPIPPVTINDAHQFPPLPHNQHPAPTSAPSPISYSRAVTHHKQPANMADHLSTFLHEFKTMFSQLIQQNSVILNMLSTVIQNLTH
jgi:hypothetical protein